MSKDSNKRRRSTSPLDILLTYVKIAGAPAAIIGLIALGNLLGKDGFSPKRLAIVIICILVIIVLLLIEKNEDHIRKHFNKAQCDTTHTKGNKSPKSTDHAAYVPEKLKPAGQEDPVSQQPKPAVHAVPVSHQPKPAVHAIPVSQQPKPAVHPVSAPESPENIETTDAKWQIGWVSGVLDDIELVYEKAEADDDIVQTLAQLESLALAEARQYCGIISISKERLTSEGFDNLSAAHKETIIALLGEKGVQTKSTDVANREIVVTLSPVFHSVLGCTMFKLLNWLEKLDGALNVMVDGKVMLTFQVPLGGRKGLVQWEMLIMQLYPWLCIREISSNFIASPLSDVKKASGASKGSTPPSSPAQSSDRQDLTTKGAAQAESIPLACDKAKRREPTAVERETRTLSIYSEGAHGDQVDIVHKGDHFEVGAWNDGYPNRMGGGGTSVKLPEDLVNDYSHSQFLIWIHESIPWVKKITSYNLLVSEKQVRQFFADNISSKT